MNSSVKKIGVTVAIVLGTLFALKAGRNLPIIRQIGQAVS